MDFLRSTSRSIILSLSNSFSSWVSLSDITANQRNCGKIMFLLVSVCQSVHGRCHMTITTIKAGWSHPLDIRSGTPLPRTIFKRAVRTLLECFLVDHRIFLHVLYKLNSTDLFWRPPPTLNLSLISLKSLLVGCLVTKNSSEINCWIFQSYRSNFSPENRYFELTVYSHLFI